MLRVAIILSLFNRYSLLASTAYKMVFDAIARLNVSYLIATRYSQQVFSSIDVASCDWKTANKSLLATRNFMNMFSKVTSHD